MFVLKAFATHDLFINNTPGIVSNIGELSTRSMTYSRDKGTYKSANFPESSLVTFTSADNGSPVQLTSNLVDEVAIITKYIYNRSISVQGVIYRDELLQYLITTYSNIGLNFNMGAIVNNGTYFIPEWVSWESNLLTVAGKVNTLKIWFSDTSFKNQYDGFDIVVVPPIANLNDFFTPASMVLTDVNSVSPSVLMNNIQIAKNNLPETIIRAEVINYVDPTNPANVIPTTWSLLIYGDAGNSIDAIQNALTTYITTNSVHNSSDWGVIFPDLFKRNEFSIIPLWNRYSIPDRVLNAGIYSPISNITSDLAQIKGLINTYPASHIDANTSVMFQPYKALSLLVVSSPDNKVGMNNITDLFSDYIPVTSTSNDFSRMSLNTQMWSELLANMIYVAETMDLYSSIPAGMTKVVRNNVLYLVSKFQSVNYLLAAKISIH